MHKSTIIFQIKDSAKSAALLKASNVSPLALFTDAIDPSVCGRIHPVIRTFLAAIRRAKRTLL